MTRTVQLGAWVIGLMGLYGHAQAQPDREAPVPATAPGPLRIGVSLGEGAFGEWQITGVAPLSPAHRAGLRPGDLIIAVRGSPVSYDAPERFRDLMRESPVLMTVERADAQRFMVIPKRLLLP